MLSANSVLIDTLWCTAFQEVGLFPDETFIKISGLWYSQNFTQAKPRHNYFYLEPSLWRKRQNGCTFFWRIALESGRMFSQNTLGLSFFFLILNSSHLCGSNQPPFLSVHSRSIRISNTYEWVWGRCRFIPAVKSEYHKSTSTILIQRHRKRSKKAITYKQEIKRYNQANFIYRPSWVIITVSLTNYTAKKFFNYTEFSSTYTKQKYEISVGFSHYRDPKISQRLTSSISYWFSILIQIFF